MKEYFLSKVSAMKEEKFNITWPILKNNTRLRISMNQI